MGGLINFIWLALFVAIGFPVALGIELYLRRGKHAPMPENHIMPDEFMPVPQDSAIARRTRTATDEPLDS